MQKSEKCLELFAQDFRSDKDADALARGGGELGPMEAVDELGPGGGDPAVIAVRAC